MRHRFSRRIGMFVLAAVLFFGAAGLLGAGEGMLAAGLALWAAGGGVFLYLPARRLERGMEKLPDLEKFEENFRREPDPAVRDMAADFLRLGRELDNRYAAKVMDKQTRIDVLQGQINPHFLYNTLECIRSEAILRGNDSIARMSKALAAFFRYSISRKEKVVTVRDELNNIRNYFLIQEYRFENKFSLDIRVEEGDEEVFDYLIPKMTLQPIVENSIFHGLETKPDKGKVGIRVFTTDEKVVLVVSDDGVGIGKEELMRMRSRLLRVPDGGESGQGGDRPGNGIALYNVNQRIKLFFGEDYGIQLYSTPGVGTEVEILLPRMRDRRDVEEREK